MNLRRSLPPGPPASRRRIAGWAARCVLGILGLSGGCTRSPGLENSLDGDWTLSLSCLTNRDIIVTIQGENSVWEDTNTGTGCVMTRTIRISHVKPTLLRLVEENLPTCSPAACDTTCADSSKLADWSFTLTDTTSRESFTLLAGFSGKGYENEGTCSGSSPNTMTFTPYAP